MSERVAAGGSPAAPTERVGEPRGRLALSILRDEQADRVGGVLHCFSGDVDMAIAKWDGGNVRLLDNRKTGMGAGLYRSNRFGKLGQNWGSEIAGRVNTPCCPAWGSKIFGFVALAVGLTLIARKGHELQLGAGGKTLALAALLQNRGSILAVDSDGRRLGDLRGGGFRRFGAGVHVRAGLYPGAQVQPQHLSHGHHDPR